MFRGSERIRLIAMLGTLCILGLIIFGSINSGLRKPPADDREREPTQAENNQQAAAPLDKPAAKGPAENDAVAPGPTEDDSEEQAAARDEFQALTDGTLGIQPEEMFAYRRVFGWAQHQSFAAMKQRADKNIRFDDLMRHAGKFRGKLLQIDLDVRQAILVDGQGLGVKTVYELRGFSQDSGAWLYFVIVPSLPQGMASGPNIEERVRVEGYFFKLHGYLEAGAKPRAAPLKAPLLIGRAKRLITASEKTASTDNPWLYYAAAGFVLLSFIFTLAQFLSRRRARRRQAQLDEYKLERSREWTPREKLSGSDVSSPRADSQDNTEDGFDFRRKP
jgi:hypothetical protein